MPRLVVHVLHIEVLQWERQQEGSISQRQFIDLHPGKTLLLIMRYVSTSEAASEVKQGTDDRRHTNSLRSVETSACYGKADKGHDEIGSCLLSAGLSVALPLEQSPSPSLGSCVVDPAREPILGFHSQ